MLWDAWQNAHSQAWAADTPGSGLQFEFLRPPFRERRLYLPVSLSPLGVTLSRAGSFSAPHRWLVPTADPPPLPGAPPGAPRAHPGEADAADGPAQHVREHGRVRVGRGEVGKEVGAVPVCHLRGDRAQPHVRRTQGPSFPGFFSWPRSSSVSDASRPLQQPWLHHPCTPRLFCSRLAGGARGRGVRGKGADVQGHVPSGEPRLSKATGSGDI